MGRFLLTATLADTAFLWGYRLSASRRPQRAGRGDAAKK